MLEQKITWMSVLMHLLSNVAVTIRTIYLILSHLPPQGVRCSIEQYKIHCIKSINDHFCIFLHHFYWQYHGFTSDVSLNTCKQVFYLKKVWCGLIYLRSLSLSVPASQHRRPTGWYMCYQPKSLGAGPENSFLLLFINTSYVLYIYPNK